MVEGTMPSGQDAAMWALARGSALVPGLGEAWGCTLV